VRLFPQAGALCFWETLWEVKKTPADLRWLGMEESEDMEAWISPESLLWVSQTPGWSVVDAKGRAPLEEIARIEMDLEAGLVRGTGKATASEISETLPEGWRLRGKKPRKAKGEGRWTLPVERYQLVLFEEDRP